MAKKVVDNTKEEITQKYNKIRKTFELVCKEKKLPCQDYLKNFPIDASENLSVRQISNLVNALNKDLRLLIKGLYLEDWHKTICDSFGEEQQVGIIELLETTLKGYPADAYKYFSKTNDLLKLLNDEQTRAAALCFLENYCATNSFENIVNNYGLVFKSKHGKDAVEARDNGLARRNVLERKRTSEYRAYFKVSAETELDEQTPAQPGEEY